jgi:hypothetical protein
MHKHGTSSFLPASRSQLDAARLLSRDKQRRGGAELRHGSPTEPQS